MTPASPGSSTSTPRSIRLGDPLRRSFLDELRRRTLLPHRLAAEWTAADSDLVVAVGDDDERTVLVLAPGPLGGPRRWIMRQPLHSDGEGDLVEQFELAARARGRAATDAAREARTSTRDFVQALDDALRSVARLRPERGSILLAVADALRVPPEREPPPTEDRPPADDPRPRERDAVPVSTAATRPEATPAARAPKSHRRITGRARVLVTTVFVGSLVIAGVVTARTPRQPDSVAAEGGQVGAAAGATAGFAVSLENADGDPVRLDPCHTYDYVVQRGGLDAETAAAEVGAGFAALEEATGIAFRFAGFTDERFPHPADPREPPRLPILVSLERAADSSALLEGASAHHAISGQPLGGLALASPVNVRPGVSVLAGGAVVINEELEPAQRARVLLHELGHLAGLDHPDDPAQLMATPVPQTGPTAYRDGDRAGLEALGAPRGCALTDDERAVLLAAA